jgi:long-chain acyl-CoA synthetase
MDFCFPSQAGNSTVIPPDFKYTREVTNLPKVKGEGLPRRYYKDLDNPLSKHPENISNLHANFVQAVAKAGKENFLGHRIMYDGVNGPATVAGPFVWQTYNEIAVRVANLGSGLVSMGLKPDAMVGFFSNNIPQWVIAEHACYMQGLITVPLYDTLGHEAVEYIVLHF